MTVHGWLQAFKVLFLLLQRVLEKAYRFQRFMKNGLEASYKSRMMVWDARGYFIHERKMLRSEALSLKWEYQFIRILLIYLINPIGIVNLPSVIHWSMMFLMSNRYFTLKSIRKWGRSTGRVNVEVRLSTSCVLLHLRNRVILQICFK